MEISSSEGSADEEEVFRNFDEEARLIVQNETLPKKSADRYLLVYNVYKKWREDNESSLSTSEENNLIIYFEDLKKKLKPPTLWSIWSMLKKTLSTKDDIDITNFLNLKNIIKINAKGYQPKKAFVYKWTEIVKFMREAPDDMYLAMKAVLVFGICGCLRCDEITNMKFEDVEDLGNKYLVSIHSNKNEYSGQFIIGDLFYATIKKYISLRPSDQFSDRFFIRYQKGKCFRQPIGRHKIGQIPENIASYLQLRNPQRYTGHCFRRTSATLLSESGANMQMIKQLGRWRSDLIAQGYIENSLLNRELIFNGIVQRGTKKIHQQPSTHVRVDMENENIDPDDNLNWADFDEEFTIAEVHSVPSNFVESKFTTANKRPILIPVKNLNNTNVGKRTPFLDKPGIKLNFKNQSISHQSSPSDTSKSNQNSKDNQLNRQQLPSFKYSKNDRVSENNQSTSYQPPPLKKHRNNEHFKDENHNDISAIMRENNLKFDQCTFNTCTFNIVPCRCNNENNS